VRLLHTADWHLGRIFHARSLIDDQAHVLDQFVALVRELRPDAVLIAGDVYDRAVPPADAVNLLDDTLSRIVLGEGVPVVLIAGNHDSPDRLGFGARLLAPRGLTIAGRVSSRVEPLYFADEWGKLAIYPLPYAEPAVVRDALGAEFRDHDAALGALLDGIREHHPAGTRAVVVAHAFVAGGAESESERPLSVGGSGAVAASRFAGFDYVALGHLHRPQQIGSAAINYAGSPLKYSLSEIDHDKSVSLVELRSPGELRVERIALRSRRDLRRVRGELRALVEAGRDDPKRHDYLFASLTDTGALLEPMARLREVYPNVLGCERIVLSGIGSGGKVSPNHRELDMRVLFADFVHEVTGEPLDDAARHAVDVTIEALLREEREST
jgi:DNA repair protein SbcD/Mre11